MRKLVTWLLVTLGPITLGIAALVRKLRRKRQRGRAEAPSAKTTAVATAPDVAVAQDDPAEELRRKLADSREDAAAKPSGEGAPEPSIDERRTDVHEQARAAIDEMQRSSED
jgi:hypothetical protein